MTKTPDDAALVHLLHGAGMDPLLAYVFGSRATGRIHPGSDLDLAILPRQSLDPVACFEAAQQIAGEIGIDVDLVDLARASAVLRKEVVRTGRPILGADSRWHHEFEMMALADYARLNEERRELIALWNEGAG